MSIANDTVIIKTLHSSMDRLNEARVIAWLAGEKLYIPVWID